RAVAPVHRRGRGLGDCPAARFVMPLRRPLSGILWPALPSRGARGRGRPVPMAPGRGPLVAAGVGPPPGGAARGAAAPPRPARPPGARRAGSPAPRRAASAPPVLALGHRHAATGDAGPVSRLLVEAVGPLQDRLWRQRRHAGLGAPAALAVQQPGKRLAAGGG